MEDMDNVEGASIEPLENKPQEFKHEKPKINPFLSRGCCESPKMYQKNDSVFQHRCSMFDSFDWLKSIPAPENSGSYPLVEVRFKSNRKDYFRPPPEMELEVGDIVAVEASPGHDIGIVSMIGEMVRFQLKKKNQESKQEEIKKVYRRARLTDIEKWISAVEGESSTMNIARTIAEQAGLMMKINDVEYQGDNTKAIFYYTADERVDFRELIKILAEEFKVRIEMRQIGARQEASRLGGIGSCGRELCCATWMNDFKSVTTNAARVQQLSLNPQKLAGQCGKLKCCLNYEYDTYIDAIKGFPNTDVILKTKKGEATHQKTDIFQKLMWYSYISDPSNLMAIPVDKVIFILDENKKGNLPECLEDFSYIKEVKTAFDSSLSQDELTRFDHL
jgi:cell fate regulator YaaT (PSP1 superfamily)